jgi:hypothetical protein
MFRYGGLIPDNARAVELPTLSSLPFLVHT